MTIVHTYQLVKEHMVHNGYFIVTPEFPLKWISVQDFAKLQDGNK